MSFIEYDREEDDYMGEGEGQAWQKDGEGIMGGEGMEGEGQLSNRAQKSQSVAAALMADLGLDDEPIITKKKTKTFGQGEGQLNFAPEQEPEDFEEERGPRNRGRTREREFEEVETLSSMLIDGMVKHAPTQWLCCLKNHPQWNIWLWGCFLCLSFEIMLITVGFIDFNATCGLAGALFLGLMYVVFFTRELRWQLQDENGIKHIPKLCIFSAGLVGLAVGLFYARQLTAEYDELGEVDFSAVGVTLFVSTLLWPLMVIVFMMVILTFV